MPVEEAALSLPDSSIQHFSHHEHRLYLFPAANLFSRCAICNRGFQAKRNSNLYGCLSCGYYIHDTCAALPERTNHSLHPLHPLRLVERSVAASCYYCEKPFSTDDRYVYTCELCSSFYMHIACAMIPLPAVSSDVDGGQDHHGVAQYVCHQQPMALVEHPDGSKADAKCFVCQSQWSGPAYSCNNAECENFLHKSCAELPKKIRHPFHSRHPLKLQVCKPLSCDSCLKNNCKLIFGCHEDGCNFNLGVECASLNTNVTCRSHDHVLFLVEKASGEIQCDACQKSYKSRVDIVPNEISRTQSNLFRCMDCNFNFHFLCGPLPFKLNYEDHIHPLTLSDHSVTEDYSEEYFCDVCEGERDPHFRVYYCEECKYVAHIHCMISKIVKVIKGNSKEVELWALGENRWAIESLMDCQALRSGDLKHENAELGIKELIMKDIMRSLTEQEKQKLASPFMSGHRPDVALVMFQIREGMYIDSKKLNARFDREGPAKDSDKIEQLFRFQSSDFSWFIEELQFYRPPGGLKLDDDKFLRQKAENVNGYMVPRTLTPILRTLLQKHPDLGGCDSSLTPAMKSVTSSLLCIVFDRMCKIKVEDITKDDFKYWYFYLQGIRKIANFKIIDSLLDPLEVLARAFLGLEVIRYEKEGIQKLNSRVAELKRRISEFEAELSRCEELCEKHKEYGRTMASDFILKSFSLASELKWKNACDVVLSKIL